MYGYCASCLCTTTHVHGALGGQKRTLDPLELELEMVVIHHVGAGTWTLRSSTKVTSALNPWAIPPALKSTFLTTSPTGAHHFLQLQSLASFWLPSHRCFPTLSMRATYTACGSSTRLPLSTPFSPSSCAHSHGSCVLTTIFPMWCSYYHSSVFLHN